MSDPTPFTTLQIPEAYDVLAPDGSEIRMLSTGTRGSMAHGTLPPGGVSRAIRHRTVEEVWFIISGHGQVWRRLEDREEVVDVASGTSLTIPVGTAFQFRTTGPDALCFIMCTMPPWPGEDEAVFVDGFWSIDTE